MSRKTRTRYEVIGGSVVPVSREAHNVGTHVREGVEDVLRAGGSQGFVDAGIQTVARASANMIDQLAALNAAKRRSARNKARRA